MKDERDGRIGQGKNSDHPTALNLRKAKEGRGRNRQVEPGTTWQLWANLRQSHEERWGKDGSVPSEDSQWAEVAWP